MYSWSVPSAVSAPSQGYQAACPRGSDRPAPPVPRVQVQGVSVQPQDCGKGAGQGPRPRSTALGNQGALLPGPSPLPACLAVPRHPGLRAQGPALLPDTGSLPLAACRVEGQLTQL